MWQPTQFGSHLKPQQTYEHKEPHRNWSEMRHFNWQRYNHYGIKDILNMNDYVDLVVGKIDRYNAGEYEDSWDKEEIVRDLPTSVITYWSQSVMRVGRM